jgi:hypothetical protein
VHHDLAGSDVGRVAHLQPEPARRVDDRELAVLAERDRLAVLERISAESRVSGSLSRSNAPSLKMLQFW